MVILLVTIFLVTATRFIVSMVTKHNFEPHISATKQDRDMWFSVKVILEVSGL